MFAYGYTRRTIDDRLGDKQQAEILRVFKAALEPQGYLFGNRGEPVPGGWFTDSIAAGRKPLHWRPAGNALDRIVERGDVVIIATMAAGFHSLKDCLSTIKTWQARGIHVLLLDAPLDTGTPVGSQFLAMASHFADFAKKLISESTKEALAIRRAKGLPASRHAPYGMKLVRKNGRPQFVPDPYTRSCGAKIVEWSRAGMTVERIYFEFLRQRITTRDGKEWSLSRIRNTLQNELQLQAQEAAKAGTAAASSP